MSGIVSRLAYVLSEVTDGGDDRLWIPSITRCKVKRKPQFWARPGAGRLPPTWDSSPLLYRDLRSIHVTCTSQKAYYPTRHLSRQALEDRVPTTDLRCRGISRARPEEITCISFSTYNRVVRPVAGTQTNSGSSYLVFFCHYMEDMKRLQTGYGGTPEDEINALARGGKLRGHIPGVGRVLPSRATSRPRAHPRA
ncbi:hypothetical protein Tco_0317459 [Tanacetum coccineum]